jgi:hypothetical protein
MNNKAQFFEKLARRRLDLSKLPIRRREKKTRFYIDNEYLDKGYAKAFSTSISMVYAVLARHANARNQTCFPSIETIMRKGGIGNRNTVVAAIKKLEEYNFIVVDHSKGRRSNLYVLLDSQHWKSINDINFDMVAKEQDDFPS